MVAARFFVDERHDKQIEEQVEGKKISGMNFFQRLKKVRRHIEMSAHLYRIKNINLSFVQKPRNRPIH